MFGNRCQRSHKGDLKTANASRNHNEGSSDSYDSRVNNGMVQSDKRSASEAEDEEAQENVQDSLPNGHMLNPIPSEEHAEPDVQDSGPSRDDILNLPSHINIAKKEVCIFFIQGTCSDGDCDFSHLISKDIETANSGRFKGPNLSKSYLYSSFFFPDHVAHRIVHCSKAPRLVVQEGLQTLPSGVLPTRKRLYISPSTGPADEVVNKSSRYFY